MDEQWRDQAGAGFAVSAQSHDGWVQVRRDVDTGEVSVRFAPGALSGRTERAVAEQIRSALLAAAHQYGRTFREAWRREHGELPNEIRAWASTR